MTDEAGTAADDSDRPVPPIVRKWTREPAEDPSPTAGGRGDGDPPGGAIGPRPETMTLAVAAGTGTGALSTLDTILRITSAGPAAVAVCLLCLVLSIVLLFGAYRAFVGTDTRQLMVSAGGVLVCTGILELSADSGRGLEVGVLLLIGPALAMLLCRVKDSTDWIRLGGGTQF